MCECVCECACMSVCVNVHALNSMCLFFKIKYCSEPNIKGLQRSDSQWDPGSPPARPSAPCPSVAAQTHSESRSPQGKPGGLSPHLPSGHPSLLIVTGTLWSRGQARAGQEHLGQLARELERAAGTGAGSQTLVSRSSACTTTTGTTLSTTSGTASAWPR